MAAKEAGCYKVILDCAEANAAFYEKCGLTRKEVQMVRCSSDCSHDKGLCLSTVQQFTRP